MLKKTPIFLILFFTFYISQVQAQNTANKIIDSLKTELKNAETDSRKAILYKELSSHIEYIGPDNTIKYAKKALYYAQKIDDEILIGNAYGNLGTAYELKSDYTHALKNLYKALEIIEKTDDIIALIRVNNNLGLIYIDIKNYKQGLFYYKKALKICYKYNKEKHVSILLNNIGDFYLQQREYKKALNQFYQALIISKKLNDTDKIGLNLTNIGICYVNIKNYEKGVEMLNKSIATYENSSNLYNAYNYYELGRAYYLMSQDEKYSASKSIYVDKSVNILNYVLQNFKNYSSLKDIQDTYYYLSKGNKAKEKFDVALDCFEKYSKIKDSLFSKESEKKMANFEYQRKIDLKDKQIEIQTLKINSDTRKVYFLITISTAVAILLGLFLFLYISKRRNNQLLKEKNKLISDINYQKDKFYSIIAHDLKGPFNGFLGLSELMAEDIDDMSNEEIKFAATNMRSSAKNLFNLLENLLDWTRMEQNIVPFDPKEYPLESTTLESIITLHDIAGKKEINIETKIPSTLSVFADINMFQAIIRNIVLNAIKFTQKKGAVYIHAFENSTDITITIKDSGIGMHQDIINDLFKIDTKNNRIGTENEPSTGLGLILCKEFIEKHNGQIWVESEEGKGSTFYIRFPKNQNT
ncbi:tetratricopeptide repeat-containing sensor histidine kinase [Flavobacterium sp. 5]|uniref:tetratricopeptide repeat-containing sensor histidine kinase n=1 Tax=Flavobacterium sp. 5 TaxID=2035199 RepID=UPI000C2B9295|nr:tetratricopeptide repeat-containing sensor histidine kinase [Flavobacterium sp. 5]PKB15628.1 signal transduction histidine kinase [Flavobacterium sp. 5]